MATIKLLVKSDKKQSLATMYLRFINGRETDIIVPIPIKIYPEYWSNKSQAFKPKIVFDDVFTEKDKVKIENKLRTMKNNILNQFNELAGSGGTITKDWLKSIIDEHHNKPGTQNENLNQYINRFIKEVESGERTYVHNNESKRYEYSTIKNFKAFKVQFDLYQQDKRVKLNFNDINIDFYDQFVQFFLKKSYSPNTIGRNIKNLKTLMRLSRDEGLHSNTETDRKKFKVLKTQVQNIYLTESELDRISELDLSDNKVLEVARDVFLIGCYTAQRFSDYSKIGPANVRQMDEGFKVIDLIQSKTRERVIIPIRPELEEILKKYDYQVPHIWEQKLNLHIKKIGAMAGITEKIEVEEIKGGLKVKKWVPKNEMIKTHTCRRTGCTLMYLAGIPTIDVMKVSGHKTEREFLNYIKVSKEETALSLSKHPYFMGTKLKVVK
ncbi:MAG: phage integrase SAM-like domain-containing protein [Bacteroidales bacterium]|nr:phage integrase SAM-like domain-containing protein [Bacteroidales bacterium]